MSNEELLTAPPFLAGLRTRVPCTEQPTLFHPPDDGYRDMGGHGRRHTAEALALCRTCPVMQQCRQWARDRGEFGIWGAETDTQRLARGHRSRVRTGAQDRSWETRKVRVSSKAAQREPAWPPPLTPVEEEVLVALSGGIRPQDVGEELARSQSVVMRALLGLQRKLRTDVAGLVDVACEAGLVERPYRSVA